MFRQVVLVFTIALLVPAPCMGQFKERDVSDPQVSPDGNWVAYTVDSTDVKADESYTHIWMTRFDGAQTIQLTNRAHESESTPRFTSAW